MKRLSLILASMLVLASLLLASCAPAPVASSADLHIMSGPSAMRFLGNGNDGLLLAQFSKKTGVSVYVETLSGPEALAVKNASLAGAANLPKVFVFDDSVYADGLLNVKYIASSKVGLWIRSDKAKDLGLSGNTLSFDKFAELLQSGSILAAAGNATSSTESAEFFYSTLSWCSNTDSSNLTMTMVRDAGIRACGKKVYDFIKTTNSTQQAVDLVLDGMKNNQANSYNAVIAFDSALLGNDLNTGNPHMKFFYFTEATPVVQFIVGSVSTEDQKTNQAVQDLGNFLLTEEAQALINLKGYSNGASTMVVPDESAFKPEWGVRMNPSGVQLVNPPISAVAFDALTVYRDYYKRAKEINICIDLSGSTQNGVRVKENGKDVEIPRLQAIDRAIVTITDPSWQTKNMVQPGPKDVINFYFFSTIVSPKVASSTGTDTKQAGDIVNKLIGPAYNTDKERFNFDRVGAKVGGAIPGFTLSNTAMFDCANTVNDDINKRYDPNLDYYILILTDGKKTVGLDGVVLDLSRKNRTDVPSFYNNWLNSGHSNVSLVGIQFGDEGNDLAITPMFNGATYNGTNDAELIQAFKKILGN